jgi:glycosyltransferase-like protein
VALLTYSTKPRGGVVHTLALAEALAARGASVQVWTLGRGGDTGFYRLVDPGVALRVVPFPDVEGEGVGPRILRSIAVLRAALETGLDADVVHAQDCLSANAALAVRPDTIRTVHHIDRFSTPELVHCHERALYDPSLHICVSAAVAAELGRDWGITATVIPNGVDAGRFAAAAGPAGAEQRAAWQQRFGRYVLAVGGIEPRKGTLELVEAMSELRLTHPSARLVIAGGETLFDYRGYRATVLARAEELHVEPELLGPVAHEQLPALVAGAGVFAFPSVQEGFGLAAMEALAARVPVVVRDLPVLREVFDGAVRFAADTPGLAAALDAALNAGPGRGPGAGPAHEAPTALADRGSELAARHTWDAAARAHLDLYRTLGAGTRSQGRQPAS